MDKINFLTKEGKDMVNLLQIVPETPWNFICDHMPCSRPPLIIWATWHLQNADQAPYYIYRVNEQIGAAGWACDKHKADLEYRITGKLPDYVTESVTSISNTSNIVSGKTFIMKGSGAIAVVMEVNGNKVNVNINGHESGFIPIDEFLSDTV